MPLQVSTESPSAIAQSLDSTSSQPSFLVVYASHVNGRSWCGDCRDAEPLVDAKFADRGEVVKVVYAGQQDEWRKAENPWKQAPFSVTNLPTIIKVTGNKWERLVEEDVYNQKKLDAFVGPNTKHAQQHL
ncbi:Thioredoxin-like protein [Lachnellula hyalina]|uniref:Thioredoxin-like protein n=1 Tax=Lachnellula hyalina TaxID=1316788 RepID=A0A8H8QZF7_9HELO|nr:Thioredoxin-like protein [Lachnellula hyalina]TVY25727.1 Thioredoxin-like protein [Lachnellula hyalina]